MGRPKCGHLAFTAKRFPPWLATMIDPSALSTILRPPSGISDKVPTNKSAFNFVFETTRLWCNTKPRATANKATIKKTNKEFMFDGYSRGLEFEGNIPQIVDKIATTNFWFRLLLSLFVCQWSAIAAVEEQRSLKRKGNTPPPTPPLSARHKRVASYSALFSREQV